MNRQRRTRILVEGNPALSEAIATQITRTYPVEQVGEAREILVMVKVRESARGSLFYLGEVLAVESKARLGETQGLGLLIGSDEKRAYELAVIDTAFNVAESLPERQTWVDLLEQEERELKRSARRNQACLEQTRVEFSSMLTASEQAEGVR